MKITRGAKPAREPAKSTAPERAGKNEIIAQFVELVAQKTEKDWFTQTHNAQITAEPEQDGAKLNMEWHEYAPAVNGDSVNVEEKEFSVSIHIGLTGEWPEKRQKLMSQNAAKVLLEKAKDYQRSLKAKQRPAQQAPA